MKVHAKDRGVIVCGAKKAMRAIGSVMFWRVNPPDRCKRCEQAQWPTARRGESL